MEPTARRLDSSPDNRSTSTFGGRRRSAVRNRRRACVPPPGRYTEQPKCEINLSRFRRFLRTHKRRAAGNADIHSAARLPSASRCKHGARGRPYGFASQSYGWFAFIEDDDAAGSVLLASLPTLTSVRNRMVQLEEKFRRWRPLALTFRSHSTTCCPTPHETYVKFARCQKS